MVIEADFRQNTFRTDFEKKIKGRMRKFKNKDVSNLF